MTDLVVVGAGITGLAAAWEAQRGGGDVIVLDADQAAGGKLRTSSIGGRAVDESADAFLARVPEAIELCEELGIAGDLVSPAVGRAFIWLQDGLRPLPQDQLLGVPTDLEAVAASGILSAAGVARAAEDLERQDDRPPGDESVGALIRRRLGDEVLDRLVGPLLGGIWAADCDQLSLATAAPALAQARDRAPSLIRGAVELRAEAASTNGDQPVFLAPRGGMSEVVDALAKALGDRVRLGHPVTALERDGSRWRVEPAGISAGAVLIATPAFAAAPLLTDASPRAAATLAAIDHASVTLVTLAVPRDGVDHPLDGSGFLVPASSGRLLTACSWTSSKWAHLAGDGSVALLRASLGRHGDERAARLDDEALTRAVLADLGDTMGLRAQPLELRVTRWAKSFPQPRPGHLDRVSALEADLAKDAPGLAVAGAWARGIGIPACIRSGRRAAADILGMPSFGPS